MKINNRRYIGSKYKLTPWLRELIQEHCTGDSFFDVFAGSGAVTASLFDCFSTFILNDFLYSNEVVYNAFFSKETFNREKIHKYQILFDQIDGNSIAENYVSQNYGDKYFANADARVIGQIREDLQELHNNKNLNDKEYYILLASLLYSLDRIANTVGHFDAYVQKKTLTAAFKFELIEPYDVSQKEIAIFREDSNSLASKISADVAFVDPPYNSRQYSRFYHVWENIAKWEKPTLSGVAQKPPLENMSDYCRSSAPKAFDDLIQKLDALYIVVTYNNTYNSKSSSSLNKISLEDIEAILTRRGATSRFESDYRYFNAGKTNLAEHKEIVFITKVK